MEFLSLKKIIIIWELHCMFYQSNTASTHIHLLPCQISLLECKHVSTKAVLRGTLQQHGSRALMFSLTMAQVLQSTSEVDLTLHDWEFIFFRGNDKRSERWTETCHFAVKCMDVLFWDVKKDQEMCNICMASFPFI